MSEVEVHVGADGVRKMGSGIRSFEDLHIFQEARALANQVYSLTRQKPMAADYAYVDQVRRSSLSILSNIAEGFERETNAEFIRSLYIARGSCGELRAQLLLGLDQTYLKKEDYESATTRCRKISAGIYNLIRHLRRQPASPHISPTAP